ncbi:unnamed protein product [Moneuplotes crassus]|uniref:Uncharacterized protein n=1 Tax=Euplotes crassus TaxID=5936 RepID=A0AAD1U6W5_EUPCR|nr:unnamed protein product [Moneuplotes crassus]
MSTYFGSIIECHSVIPYLSIGISMKWQEILQVATIVFGKSKIPCVSLFKLSKATRKFFLRCSLYKHMQFRFVLYTLNDIKNLIKFLKAIQKKTSTEDTLIPITIIRVDIDLLASSADEEQEDILETLLYKTNTLHNKLEFASRGRVYYDPKYKMDMPEIDHALRELKKIKSIEQIEQKEEGKNFNCTTFVRSVVSNDRILAFDPSKLLVLSIQTLVNTPKYLKALENALEGVDPQQVNLVWEDVRFAANPGEWNCSILFSALKYGAITIRQKICARRKDPNRNILKCGKVKVYFKREEELSCMKFDHFVFGNIDVRGEEFGFKEEDYMVLTGGNCWSELFECSHGTEVWDLDSDDDVEWIRSVLYSEEDQWRILVKLEGGIEHVTAVSPVFLKVLATAEVKPRSIVYDQKLFSGKTKGKVQILECEDQILRIQMKDFKHFDGRIMMRSGLTNLKTFVIEYVSWCNPDESKSGTNWLKTKESRVKFIQMISDCIPFETLIFRFHLKYRTAGDNLLLPYEFKVASEEFSKKKDIIGTCLEYRDPENIDKMKTHPITKLAKKYIQVMEQQDGFDPF